MNVKELRKYLKETAFEIDKIGKIVKKSKAKRDKEFNENRTSWKWFYKLWNKEHRNIIIPGAKGYSELLLIGILKELQHLNDKS